MTSSSYYDITNILSEEERVASTFNVNALNMGFLDNTSKNNNLEQGAHVELPLWINNALAQRNMVTVETPKHYTNKFRSHLLADPNAMNLRERSPYYYETGAKLLPYVDASEPILNTLIKSLSIRYQTILNKSQNSRNEDTSSYTLSLTQLERSLFQAGFCGSDELFRWKRRDCERLTSARPFKRARSI